MIKKIGINLLFINPKLAGGSVTYAMKLVKEISKLDKENQYVIYINRECQHFNFEVGDNFRIRILNFEYSSVYLRYFWEQVILPFYVFKDKVDLLHSLGYVTPLFLTAKKVVSILDINYKGHSNNMSASKRFLLGSMVNLSAIFSQKIITISEFSKNQIIKYTHTKPDKIVVTLLSGSSDLVLEKAREEEIKSKYKINGSYIIAFSSPSPHKNILRLIESFKKVTEKYPELLLVLVGHQHKSTGLVDLIYNLELTSNVIFTGFVPDEHINPLISEAKIFAFPSLYEGFGIPLLDAQQCSVSVVSSNAGSLPEVGGDSVKYFTPDNVTEISESIFSLLEDEAYVLRNVKLGYENRKKFSWRKTAIETFNVYKDILDT
jgi:glycosyltransferase involved in cell wall biosynthesis